MRQLRPFVLSSLVVSWSLASARIKMVRSDVECIALGVVGLFEFALLKCMGTSLNYCP